MHETGDLVQRLLGRAVLQQAVALHEVALRLDDGKDVARVQDAVLDDRSGQQPPRLGQHQAAQVRHEPLAVLWRERDGHLHARGEVCDDALEQGLVLPARRNGDVDESHHAAQ